MAKSKGSGMGLRNNKMIFAVIGILVVLVFVGTLTLLQNLYETERYYVLNTNVPARTLVQPEMLTEVDVSSGSGPESALDIKDVQEATIFTRFDLVEGDILTASNSTDQVEDIDIAVGVPDDWVVTSFGVSADNAVGGRIQRGYYFDFLIATATDAYYPYINMLVLDTTVSLNQASSADAAETQEAKAGQTSQYVIGMPPADAAILHQIMKEHSGDVKLVMSPWDNQFNPPSIAEYTGVFSYDIEDSPKDMGQETDPTFTARSDRDGPQSSTNESGSSTSTTAPTTTSTTDDDLSVEP